MFSHSRVSTKALRGRAQLQAVRPTGGGPRYLRQRGLWLPDGFAEPRSWHHNLVLESWGGAAARLFGGDVAYKLAAIYLEYANLSDPDDVVEAPTFDRGVSNGRAYYAGLADSANLDYIRAEIIAPQYASSDEDRYPDGNVLTVFAVATGVTGANGKPFGSANNSKIYGGALVAAPSAGDASRDIVVSRFYPGESAQMLKLASAQAGAVWELTFE